MKGLSAFRRGFVRGVQGALFLVWCLTWPVVVTLAATNGIVWLAVVGVVFSAATPFACRAFDRRAVRREQKRHNDCHGKFGKMMVQLQAASNFRVYESLAVELEMLSDAMREAPKDMVVLPGRLAEAIDERVRRLRAASPDPPAIPLQAMIQSRDSTAVDEA